MPWIDRVTRWQVFSELCSILRAGLTRAPAGLADGLPWEKLIEASSYHYVTPFLAWSALDHPQLPPDVREYLDAVLLLNTERNALLDALTERGAQALNGIDIVPVVFKGGALRLMGMYPQPGLRMTGDVDLLVPEGRAGDIRRALERAGFQPDEKPVPIGKPPLYLPGFRDPETGGGLDVQPEIVPGEFMPLVGPASQQDSYRVVELEKARVRIPGATDLIAQSIIHNQLKDEFYRRGTVQLRQLLDLYFIRDRYGAEIDWAGLEHRFEKAGLAAVLSTNMYQLELLLHQGFPEIKFQPRVGTRDILRDRIEHPRRQRGYRLAKWFEAYMLQLRTRPASIANLVNPKVFMPRLRLLMGILRDKNW